MNVLGIETSCDETAAAVVQDGRQVLSSVVFSQVALHQPYGGVVPEIASRSHAERIGSVIEESLGKSGLRWTDIDAIAVTYGPGLASSLLVGLAAGKGLSLRLQRPLCPINHIEAHIYSIFLGNDAPRAEEVCPLIALVVSGGHTCVVRVERLGQYTILGRTMDDAAGEAFDKGAQLLGLGYPGGPAMDRIARGVPAADVRFPRGRQRSDKTRYETLDPRLCFSFSGLKTSLRYYLADHPLTSDAGGTASVAAGYQEAIVDALIDRCVRAVPPQGRLAVVGGVSLNSRLRQKLTALAEKGRWKLYLAQPAYCSDNAAMVAGLAGAQTGWGVPGDLSIDVVPNLELVSRF